MEILGTTIDNLTREEILAQIKIFLDEPKFHQIATVNPEFILEAEKNSEFHSVLQNCNLRVADGFGIVLAGLLQGKYIARFPGADLLEEILFLANNKKLSVYLAVKKNGLSSYEAVKRIVSKRYTELEISGSDIDSRDIGNWKLEIGNYAIALCNFGAPEQEIFLNNLKDQKNIRLTMGVGGSFDYLTGKQKRAPWWLQSIGLEWLWRFIQQPQRWHRIWNAVVLFPFYVFFATIKKH